MAGRRKKAKTSGRGVKRARVGVGAVAVHRRRRGEHGKPPWRLQPRSPSTSLRAGWNDLPGELHREILRLVPLRDATEARQVSREMRDEVDETWRAWGIRVRRRRGELREGKREVRPWVLDRDMCSYSHSHHLASMGLVRLAWLVEQGPHLHSSPLEHAFWSRRHTSLRGQTPLMLAVQARRPVGRGADGKVEWAYALGDEEVARAVRAAVAAGADVNRRFHQALPLMSYCTERGCLEAVKACLAAKADVNAVDPNSTTALVFAAHGGHEALVGALLEAGASVKAGNRTVEVCELVRDGWPTAGTVKRLVEAGARASVDRYPCMVSAADLGDVAVMEALVELGADVGRRNSDGYTAMHFAASGEVVRWLVQRGVSVQATTGDARRGSPLMSACQWGSVDVARALVEAGADVRFADERGKTALHIVVALDCEGAMEGTAAALTRLLLEAGADPGAADRDGRTPLHKVVYAACVDLLVDAGADLEARDSLGRTPIYAALEAKFLRQRRLVFSRMVERGANLVDTGGRRGLVQRRVRELQDMLTNGRL